MKKGLVLFLALMSVLVLTACAVKAASTAGDAGTSGSSLETPVSKSKDTGSSQGGETLPKGEAVDAGSSKNEKIMISDSAMYRGTVLSIEDTAEGKTVILEQAEGTDFGALSLAFTFDADTACSFEENKLKVGAYLEVYYGRTPGEQADASKTYHAIGASLYPEAAIVICNGTLKEIPPDDQNGEAGRIVLQLMNSDQEIVFHYSEETQFYLNREELKAGDRLNILHQGMLTRSLPPQGSALEVRQYASPDKGSAQPSESKV